MQNYDTLNNVFNDLRTDWGNTPGLTRHVVVDDRTYIIGTDGHVTDVAAVLAEMYAEMGADNGA